ncbi:hypothetical protein LZL87_014120 [Fusarium oxysporum]|nr:hypothetical protein LZL87_014120 [Fusarium oxysporum]
MYSFTALSSLAVGFVFACVGCWTAAILAGSGRHQATLTVAEFDRSLFFLMIGLIPGVLSLALPKFAVVNLLIKILFPSPRHVRLLWGLAIANLVLMLGAFGVRFSECDPPSARWTLYAPAKCRSSTAIIVYSVVVGSAPSSMILENRLSSSSVVTRTRPDCIGASPASGRLQQVAC